MNRRETNEKERKNQRNNTNSINNLILVGVTVSVALNGGLFDTAKKAVQRTDKARIEEEIQGAILAALDRNGNIDLDKLKQEIEKIKGIESVEARNSLLMVKDNNGNEWTIDVNGIIETVEPEVEKVVAESDEEFSYWKTDGNGTIIYYEVPEGKEVPETLVVPNQIGEEKITKIGFLALSGFRYQRNEDGTFVMNGEQGILLDTETDENGAPIPTGQTTKIKNIIVSKGVNTIDTAAISACISLRNLTIPSTVTSVGESYIEGSVEQLENLTILGELNTIDGFYNCKNLKALNIKSSGDIEIAREAFGYCTALEKVNLQAKSIIIEGEAFSGCTNLKNVNISGVLKKIGSSGFNGCTSIKEIYISDSVVDMGFDAFAGWTNEQTIYMGLLKEPTLVGPSLGYGWASNWKSGCNANIIWGVKR